jgi:plastocyanin
MNARLTLLLLLLSTISSWAQNCTADFSFGPTDLTIDFTDQSTFSPGDPIVSWGWNFGDGSTSSAQNPTHTFPDPDKYDVCLTIETNSGCSDQLCIEIETCVLQLSVSMGDCDANNQIPITINVSDPFDAARDINISIDGVLVPGSPFDIDDDAPVSVNSSVPGDGLVHVVTVQSEDVGTCSATFELMAQDCASDCFLSSMSVGLSGGITHTVDVGDNFFAPQNITIVIGDVVHFEWVGDGHSTTSDATTGPDSWNSGEIGFGSTYDVTITNPGVHGYYCIPHGGPNGQGMAGTIVGNCPPSGQFTLAVSFNTSIASPEGYDLLLDGVPVPGSPFDYNGTGVQNQTVSLTGDGQQHVLEVQDVADPSCIITRNFQAPDCGAAPACSLSVSAQQSGGCTGNNQLPQEVTVNAINPGTSGFQVLVDGNPAPNGPFSYNSGGVTTITIEVPGDGGSHTITAQDIDDGSCSGSTSIMTTDCTVPCSLTDLSATTGGSAVQTVNVEDFTFSPQSITIASGDIVEWGWTGSVAHTTTSDATSGPDSWDSGLLGQGSVYQSPVLSAGVHPYYCIPHGGPGGQGMAGTITVQADCTGGQVQANLTFSASGTGVDGYEVLVDGTVSGTFPYDGSGQNSASVAVPGDGGAHTITVRDAADNSCSTSTTLSTPDCNAPTCQLSLTAEETGGCTDGDVTATLTVSDAGGSALGFEVQVDGSSAGTFSYSGSGTTTVQVPVAGDGQAHDIQVADLEDGTCSATTSIITTDCTVPCSLTDLSATTGGSAVQTVNVEDFSFSPQSITIAAGDIVEWAWTGSVAHTTTSDATSGPDSWDSGLLGQGSVYQSPVLSAGVHPYYCIPHGGPGGQGMAGTITVQADCTGGQVQANLTFSASGTGVDGYEVLVDGTVSGTFPYDGSGQNSASVAVPGDGGAHTITVRDAADNSCSTSTTLSTPDCNAPTCQLSLTAEETGGCTDGDVTATLTVSDAGGSALGFEVQVDGSSAGTFSYSGSGTTTVQVPVAGDGQAHDIQVADLEDGTCSASANLITTDCTIPCSLTDLTLNTSGNPVVHTVEVRDFEFSPQQIAVTAGDTIRFEWTGAIPHTSTSDANSGPESWDSGLLGQGATYDVVLETLGGHPYYCIPHGAPGGIGMTGMIEVQPPCNNGMVSISATFNADGGGDNYSVFIDGQLDGNSPYVYTINNPQTIQLTVPGDGQSRTLRIEDGQDTDCQILATFTTPDCNTTAPCSLSLGASIAGDCNDDNTVPVELTISNAGTTGSSFQLLVDGFAHPDSPFDYAPGTETLLTVNLSGNGMNRILEIVDTDSTACSATTSVGVPQCGAICEVQLLTVNTGGVAHHQVMVEDFEFVPAELTAAPGDTITFVWTGVIPHTTTSDATTGSNSWDSGLLGQGATYQLVLNEEGSYPYYCIPHGGPGGIGMAGTINVTNTCDNGMATVGVSFETTNGSAAGYQVFLDGNLIAGPIAYNDPMGANMTTVSVPGDSLAHILTVQDLEVGFCAASVSFVAPLCTLPCAIEEIKAVTGVGVDHYIEVRDFDFYPPVLNVRVGETVRFIWTGVVPHTTTSDATTGPDSWDSGLLGQGEGYEITIEEAGAHPYYCIPHGGPGGIGMAGTILAEPLCIDDSIHVSVHFSVSNGSPDGYNLFVDGTLYAQAPFLYDSLSGGNQQSIILPGDGEQHFITVQDMEVNFCAATASVVVPDCSAPCGIDSLSVVFPEPVVHEILVEDFEFVPAQLDIHTGDTVRFTWTGAIPHTTTSDATVGADVWDSGLLSQGGIYEVVIEEPGSHPYYCIPHGGPGGIGMAGVIDAVTPCEGDSVLADLTFVSTNTSGDLEVLVDGALFGNTGTTGGGLTLPGDGQLHEIIVRDADNVLCADTLQVETLLCGTPPTPCMLVASLEQEGGCEDGVVDYNLSLSAMHTGPTGFNLSVDDVLLPGSPFDYATQSVLVSLPGDGASHEIVVADADSIACADTIQVVTPDCTESCQLSLDTVLVGPIVTHVVEVRDFDFFPSTLDVTVGDVVRFVWTGAVPHTATSDATSGADTWNSGLLGQGATYEVTIQTAGEHPYYCVPHGGPGGLGMAGLINAFAACEDGALEVEIGFQAQQTGVSGFEVRVDGLLSTGSPYDYNAGTFQTVILPIVADGQNHEVEVRDTEKPDCQFSTMVEMPDCADPCLGYEAAFSYEPTTNNLEVAFADMTEGEVSSWSWTFGDGTTSTLQNPVHAFPADGIYIICLTVMNESSGCLDMHCLEIEVSSEFCNIAFDLETDGLSVILVDATQSTTPIQEWSWSLGNGTSVAGQDSLFYTYEALGVYTICLEVVSGDCTGEVCETIDLSDPCLAFTPEFTYTASPDNLLALQFVDLTAGTPNQWLWGFGDGITSNQQNPAHSYNEPGTYTVCLLVQDTLTGCNEAICETFYVGTTGTTAFRQVNYQVQISPNPASAGRSNWMVSGIAEADFFELLNLYVYDMQGRLLTEQQVQGQETVDIKPPPGLCAGLYIVELRSAHRVYQGRIIVQ